MNIVNNREIVQKAIAAYYPELSSLDVEYIGSGSYAQAFKVGELVFKITGDKQDASASLRVKDKDLKHIVKIHRVFKVANTKKWMIISEFVPYELIEADNDKYDDMADDLNDVHTELTKHLYWRHPRESVKFEFGFTIEVTEEIKAFFQELIDNDFTNADINENNIRVGKDGLFKLVDLGHYTSGKEDIDKIQFEELI